MLTPKELAALILIHRASPDDCLDLDPGNLRALVARQLIDMKRLAPDIARPVLTSNGRSMLQALIGDLPRALSSE